VGRPNPSETGVLKNVRLGISIQDNLIINRISSRFSGFLQNEFAQLDPQARPLFAFYHLDLGGGSISRSLSGNDRFPQRFRLPADYYQSSETQDDQPPFGPFDGCVPLKRFVIGITGCLLGIAIMIVGIRPNRSGWLLFGGWLIFVAASLIWLTGHTPCQDDEKSEYRQTFQHDTEKVSDGAWGRV